MKNHKFTCLLIFGIFALMLMGSNPTAMAEDQASPVPGQAIPEPHQHPHQRTVREYIQLQ